MNYALLSFFVEDGVNLAEVSKMKKIHETQSEDRAIHDETTLYSPIENLQKIENGGAYSKKSLQLDSQPRAIRYIGYFIVGFIVLSFLFIVGIALFG